LHQPAKLVAPNPNNVKTKPQKKRSADLYYSIFCIPDQTARSNAH
jgi:hypothetical protein